MTRSSSKREVKILRFTLTATGPRRSESELKREVAAAQKEALAQLRKRGVKAKVEPEGGFIGAGIDWVWLLHVSLPYLQKAAEGAAAAIGGGAAKDLYKYLKTALFKRNIVASENAEEVTKKSATTTKKKSARRGKK